MGHVLCVFLKSNFNNKMEVFDPATRLESIGHYNCQVRPSVRMFVRSFVRPIKKSKRDSYRANGL